MKNKNGTVKYRVEQLEKHYLDLDKKIDNILINHLPSLSKEVLALKTKINVLTALNIGAIVIALLVSKIF